MSDALAVEHLTVRFGDFTAVDDLSFAVHEGEIFGFLGPNGAGKTTTLRCMLDLLRPDSGGVRLFGRPGFGTRGADRREIGYLPSDWAGFPDITGRELLDLFAKLNGRPPVRRDEVLDRLGFARTALAKKLGACSTGMRQMIGITAAFQCDPKLLLLDEPTTGLDPLVRDAFLDLVRTTARAGRTVFFSSHILDEVEAVADRVLLIAKGRLELLDSVRALREKLPRVVRIRRRDGSEESRTVHGSAEDLLRSIDPAGVVDVEIRPMELAEVFRSVVRERADR